MKFLFIIIGVFFFFNRSHSDQTGQWGLVFRNTPGERTIKTTLDITPDVPFRFSSQLNLTFELHVEPDLQYGNIISLQSAKNNFRTSFIFYRHRSIDSVYFQFNIIGKNRSIKFSLAKNIFVLRPWHLVEYCIDRSKRTITIIFDGMRKEIKAKEDMPGQLSVTFGGVSFEMDNPSMVIRDINVVVDKSLPGENMHRWKLNETEGVIAHDCIGNVNGRVSSPAWNVDSYYEWKVRGDVTVPSDAAASFSGAIISFPSKQTLIEYNILTNAKSSVTYSAHRSSRSVYSVMVQNTIGIYHGGGGQISLFDKEKKTWSPIDDRFDDDMHFYGTTQFTDSVRQRVYSFGGYGWYTAKSLLRQFNFATLRWDTIPLINRNQYKERMNVSAAHSNIDGKLYLLGGIGNESGKQEDGFYPMNDLWALSVGTGRLDKIADIPLPGEIKALSWGSGPMWFAVENESTFYCLTKLNEIKIERNDTLDVYRVYSSSLNSIALLPAGEKIYLKKDEWLSGIYESSLTDELMLLKSKPCDGSDSMHYSIMTISFPPLLETSHRQLENSTTSSSTLHWSLYGGAVAVMCMVGFLVKFKKSKYILVSTQKEYKSDEMEIRTSQHRNPEINILGRFEVIDKNGTDISHIFPPLLKQLLIALIIHSNHHRRPLTTQEMTNMVWPDIGTESAKNSRGVAINRLREILKHIGDAEIEYENHLWHLRLNGGIRCDYFEYVALKGTKDKSDEWKSRYINLIERGPMLPTVSYEWFDPIRASVSEEVTTNCEEIIVNEKDEMIILRCACALLLWDSIHELAAVSAIQILSKQTKTQSAIVLYKTFCSEYKKIMEEPYSRSFESFLR